MKCYSPRFLAFNVFTVALFCTGPLFSQVHGDSKRSSAEKGPISIRDMAFINDDIAGAEPLSLEPTLERYNDRSTILDRDWDDLRKRANSNSSSLVLATKVISRFANRRSSNTLVLTLVNVGDKKVSFISGFPDLRDIRVLIRTSSGKAVAWSEDGKQAWGNFMLECYCIRKISLDPGEAKAITIPLDNYFQLSAPGDYTVLAAIDTLSDAPNSEPIASPISFTISPPRGNSPRNPPESKSDAH